MQYMLANPIGAGIRNEDHIMYFPNFIKTKLQENVVDELAQRN